MEKKKEKHILFGDKFISDTTIIENKIEITTNENLTEKKIELNGQAYLDENNRLIVPITISDMKSFELPLELIWKPLKDITTFELAQCLPYINNTDVYFDTVFQNADMKLRDEMEFMRHFLIINHNKISKLIKTEIENLNNTKSFFCYDNCSFLSITEKEQNEISVGNNLFHFCKKYHCHVKHGSYHPHLVKSEFCNYNNSEKRIPFKMEE